MSGDRYPAALWLAARFLYEPTAQDLDVRVCPETLDWIAELSQHEAN
jgi:hypothetical protein